jgi:hypothetical protein
MTIGQSEHHQEDTMAYCYKNLRPQLTIAHIELECLFVPGKPFQFSLMLVS